MAPSAARQRLPSSRRLLTFVGPVMISNVPQTDQSTVTDYYSGIPGLALMLTGYLITHPKGK
jgi:hypothetical protein